jgi:Concanavalin A-like lectin/glucanases superfamily
MQRRHPLGTYARRLIYAAVCAAFLAVLTPSAIARITVQAAGHAPVKVGRVGGRVHRAWPDRGRAPRKPRTRWIARQVGPARVRPCRRRVDKHLVPCRRARISLSDTGPAAASAAGIAGEGAGFRLHPMVATGASSSAPLSLARSYDIPTDDPSYTRLLNWAWTYDSAVAATALASAGNQSESEQLLDQLAALQHTDGSIELAFNVATGQAEPLFRAGSIAWVGLAGSVFDQEFGSSRYLSMQQLAANYLLSLQSANGLIRGGPDVSWYSTEHNLLTYALLVRLGNESQAAGNATDAVRYDDAAGRIAAAIDANLIVQNGSTAYFVQGLGDPVQALDVQALGAMYLQSRGRSSLAAAVLAYTQSAFAVSGRSVTLSSDPSTYNMTYSAAGPFSGLTPYVGANAPGVLWPEGTAEVRLATADLGEATTALDQELATFANVTAGDGGPVLEADRTVSNADYGVEYHVWPALAPTAWLLLAQQPTPPRLFGSLGSYPSVITADNPELFYRLGERTGPTAADSSANANNGIYQGGVTLGAAGSTSDGNTAATFNGTSGYVSNATQWTNPQVFTEEAWFRTTTVTGGVIVGFGNTAVGPPANFDRLVYMAGSGQLYFGIALNQTVHSTTQYNDGNWHLVDATVNASGMSLYVDGALVGTNTKASIPQGYNGYWRVGDESTGGWSAHANNFFTGTIDDVAVYPATLGAARIAAHYLAGQ